MLVRERAKRLSLVFAATFGSRRGTALALTVSGEQRPNRRGPRPYHVKKVDAGADVVGTTVFLSDEEMRAPLFWGQRPRPAPVAAAKDDNLSSEESGAGPSRESTTASGSRTSSAAQIAAESYSGSAGKITVTAAFTRQEGASTMLDLSNPSELRSFVEVRGGTGTDGHQEGAGAGGETSATASRRSKSKESHTEPQEQRKHKSACCGNDESEDSAETEERAVPTSTTTTTEAPPESETDTVTSTLWKMIPEPPSTAPAQGEVTSENVASQDGFSRLFCGGTSPYDQYHGVESQFRYLLESPELCSRHRKIPLNYEYASHLTPGGSCCVAECPEDYIPVIDEFSTTFSQTPDHVSQPPYLLIERCAPTGGSLAV